MKRKKIECEIKEFVDMNYLTCGYCKYNNARERLSHFKYCLNCGRPLGNKRVFKEKLIEQIEKNKIRGLI